MLLQKKCFLLSSRCKLLVQMDQAVHQQVLARLTGAQFH